MDMCTQTQQLLVQIKVPWLSSWSWDAVIHCFPSDPARGGLTPHLTCTHCFGLVTIRWQSKKADECFRRQLMIGAPIVRLGTKLPS
jgi:hypothetical protein